MNRLILTVTIYIVKTGLSKLNLVQSDNGVILFCATPQNKFSSTRYLTPVFGEGENVRRLKSHGFVLENEFNLKSTAIEMNSPNHMDDPIHRNNWFNRYFRLIHLFSFWLALNLALVVGVSK